MVLLVEEMMEVPTQHYKMDTHHCVLCDSLFAHRTRRAFFFSFAVSFLCKHMQGSMNVTFFPFKKKLFSSFFSFQIHSFFCF